MLKEKLTIDNIKQDLSVETKKGCKELTEMSAVFIGVLLLILASLKFGISSDSVFLWLLCCYAEAGLLVVIIRQIGKITTFHKNLKNNNAIVKDKLIYTETKSKGYG